MDKNENIRNPVESDFLRVTKPQRIRNILLKQIGRSVIDVSDNYIADDGLLVILDILTEHNCMPEKLYVRGNKLTGRSLRPLASYLVQHDSVKYLSIEWNECNDSASLAEFVNYIGSMNLMVLNMKSNKIDQNCDDVLVQLIGSPSTLLEIDLSWNELTNTSAKKIIEALKVNTRLISLGLRGNGVSQALHEQIELLCEKNLNLQPRVVEMLTKLKTEEGQLNLKPFLEDDFGEVKVAVRENLVEYLKEDLNAEKSVNKDLAQRVHLLGSNEASFKSRIAELQRDNEGLTLDNERLILENQGLKLEFEALKMDSGTKISSLEGQIRALHLSLDNKEQEYTIKMDKYLKENKQKLIDAVRQWEQR